jgi:hypothetical protein
MMHAITRVVVVSAIAAMSALGLAAAPASAVNTPPGPELGWMRLQPASGTIDDAVDGLTETKCPQGEAIIVSVAGPGIPTKGDIGYIVGNTALTALPPTQSGQLWVPLNLTFRAWFGRNVPGFTPAGTYTLTAICRDPLKSLVSFGHFSASVTIAKSGTFKALGDAALPFNTTKGEKDPLAGITASPSSGATTPGSAAPSAGAPSSTASAAPGQDPTAAAPGATPDTTSTNAAAASDSGSGVRLALLGFGALLLVGAALVALRARSAASEEPVSAGRHGSVDVH